VTVSADQVAGWRETIGRVQQRSQVLDDESLRRFAVAIGSDAESPVLGHWAWFLEARPDAGIGEDGHPKRGEFLPAVTQSRRMFAAATVDLHAPLVVGKAAEMTSRIQDVRHRAGASGDLVFVEVERRIAQDSTLKLTERQTIVYRDQGPAVTLPESADCGDGTFWVPNRVNLFRFAAATFNSHRIHYDLPYAREVEGYPDLVVQGPLTAARLAQLAGQDRTPVRVEFRLQAPLFAEQPVRLIQAADGEFRALRCDGVTAAILKATYR
jgi:3-methylfumaryl-CoA hydratase